MMDKTFLQNKCYTTLSDYFFALSVEYQKRAAFTFARGPIQTESERLARRANKMWAQRCEEYYSAARIAYESYLYHAANGS